MNLYYLHYCPDWDGMLIDSLSRKAEMACCGCAWVPQELKDRLGEQYRYAYSHYNSHQKKRGSTLQTIRRAGKLVSKCVQKEYDQDQDLIKSIKEAG